MNRLEGVACSSAAQCVAVDVVGNESTDAPGALVPEPVPVDQSPPAISGSATEGQTLTDVNGSWSNSPAGFAYQWEACDSNGVG